MRYLILVLAFALAACQAAPTLPVSPTLSASTTTPAPTSTLPPPPSATSAPPAPTPTLYISRTPFPTVTHYPTRTPRPTKTPMPPPAPLALTGKGDSVIDLDLAPFGGRALFQIDNSGSGYFGVAALDDQNQVDALLVNAVAPYSGIVAYGYWDEPAHRLQVSAAGPWSITILPETMARVCQTREPCTGTGSDVIALSGPADLARIEGNAAGRYFVVEAVTPGKYPDLLVNTTRPYTGTVPVSPAATLLIVTAVDGWSITFE